MPSLQIRHRNQDRSLTKSPVVQQQQNPTSLPVTTARQQRKASSSSCCCSCRRFLVSAILLVLLFIVVATTFWNLSFLSKDFLQQLQSNNKLQQHHGFESSQMDQAAAVALHHLHPSSAFKQKINTATAIVSSRDGDLSNSMNINPSKNNYSSIAIEHKIPKRLPTHQACQGYDGIYHIAMSDELGGIGTAFFQLVIGQILYAQAHNLKPWIHLNNFSRVFYDADIHDSGDGVHFIAMGGRNVTALHLHGQRRPFLSTMSISKKDYSSAAYYRYWRKDQTPGPPDPLQPIRQQDYHFPGTGVWEHYMEPISDFVPGDLSCQSKLYVTIQDIYLITPGIHGYADNYATSCWRYEYLPAYKTQPHVPLSEWLEPQRRRAHDVIQQFHIQPRSFIIQAALRANPNCGSKEESGSGGTGRFLCLGLHIRHSDKAAGRRQIAVAEFLPFARAFVQAGGQQIYVATDSLAVLEEIESTWPSNVRLRIRTAGNDIVRSRNSTAVFDMVDVGSQQQRGHHHRTNIEALTEIWALSQCQYLIHGLSAVSEASIWINLDLHQRSVNLEDDVNYRLTSAEFGTLVTQDKMLFVQRHNKGEEPNSVSSLYRPKATRTFSWWDQLTTRPETSAIMSVCTSGNGADGYNGILHISAVAAGAGVGHAFFTSVLNQILYAEKYHLKPWIHLQPLFSPLVYDAAVHNRSDWTLRAFDGRVEDEEHGIAGSDSPPGKPIMATTASDIAIAGNGIWETYFEPAYDFSPLHSRSCNTEPPPIATLSQRQVTFGLESFSPWAIRAWRYDTMPESIWNSQSMTIKNMLRPMRQMAHEIVKKYFRFRPVIVKRANELNPLEKDVDPPCLAVHIRAAAKDGKYRKVIAAGSYLPYMQAFVQAGGKVIYVASDSSRALRYMENDGNFPPSVTGIIRTQGIMVARSPVKDLPTHLMDDHHRVNSETLVDILAMSKCQLLVHSYSAVAEAAIYLNPSLHDNSVNLEDTEKISPEEFEHMSRTVLSKSQSQTKVLDDQNRIPSDAMSGDSGKLQYALANTTVLSRSKDHVCRSNAIVYLAQKRHSTYGRDSYSTLLRSLELLHENYLSIDDHINNMNIFIFHTNEFNDTDFKVFESRLGKSYRQKIHLIDLSGSRFWGRPQNLATSDPESWYAYPLFSEGYRHMMRFFAMEIWNFFAEWNSATGCKYRYIFRLDEDSFLHSPIRYDVFDFMRSNEYVYGYRMCTYEMAVAKRMWTRWLQQRTDWKPKREINESGCGVYNNFFVADLEFFLGDEVQAFLNFIARRGHIYKWRLGDLVIHSMVVYGYAETKQVHRFLDFTYEHGTINQTSGCLVWGGIQAGYNDPKARETLNEYYSKMIIEKNCSVNATFLQQHDLSPSYIHHLPFSLERGQLALHTIAAGGVELSGKGILSG